MVFNVGGLLKTSDGVAPIRTSSRHCRNVLVDVHL